MPTSPAPTLATVPTDPHLQDLLNLERRRLKLELNCHAIATILTFDPVTQTATAQIAYSQCYFKLGNPDQPAAIPGPQTISQVYIPYPVPYATIVSAPVVIPGGGGPLGAVLSLPVAPGDEVLVAFNDRDMSIWWASGTPGGFNATSQLHAFADAIIIVGLKSLPRSIPAYDVTFAGMRNFAGNVVNGIDLVTELARVATLDGGTLGAQIQGLITGLSTFATAGQTAAAALLAASTGPLAPLAAGHTALEAAFAALSTALAASATGFALVVE